MKALLVLLVLLPSVALCQPVPGNTDEERLGLTVEHSEEDGTRSYAFDGLAWHQPGGSSEDRLGVVFGGPIVRHLSFRAEIGVVRVYQFTRETVDMSGSEYNGGGRYYKIDVWWRFDR